MHNIGFKAIQSWYIRIKVGRVSHTDYVYFQAISKYIDEVWSKLKEAEVVVSEVIRHKSIILALKLYRGGI